MNPYMETTAPRKTSTKPLPPGKLGLPFLGETLAMARNSHRFYVERFERYGPVFKTRLFGQNVAVFVGPEAFSFFQSQPAFDRTAANPPTVERLLVENSIALVDGPLHRARKDLVLRVFEPEAMAAYLPIIERVLSRHVERWERLVTFSWQEEFDRLSGQLTAALFVGGEEEQQGQEVRDSAAQMQKGMAALPLDARFNTFGRAIAGRDRLLELIDEGVRRHRREGLPGMLGRLLDAYDEAERSDEEFRLDALHLVFACQRGITVALTLFALALGLYPQFRRQAAEEVQRAAPEGPVSLATLAKLPFLGRLSMEVRRFYPINPATFFARVTETVEYGGFRIPTGWRAVAAIHAGMCHSDAFEDPDRFDPDRFLPERMAGYHESAYIPQGGGPRNGHRCPAEDLITVLMKVTGVHLLRAHTWTFLEQDLRFDESLFPLPKDGLQAHFIPTAA